MTNENEAKRVHRDAASVTSDKKGTKSKSKGRSTITLPKESDIEHADDEPLLHFEHTMSSREKILFSAFFIVHVIFFEL